MKSELLLSGPRMPLYPEGGLMIDAAACIVGDKPGEAQITFL